MTREEIIRNLKYTMEKHKNDNVPTFGTDISLMCKDILNYLEQEPCEDVVNREAVIDEIEFYQINPQHFDFDSLINDIKDLPSVTPVRKKGKWIVEVWNNKEHHTCSSCQHIIDYEPCYHYCPNCGAEMESKE